MIKLGAMYYGIPCRTRISSSNVHQKCKRSLKLQKDRSMSNVYIKFKWSSKVQKDIEGPKGQSNYCI